MLISLRYTVVLWYLISSNLSKGNLSKCNLDKRCGTGNVSRQICERRQCCYHARPDDFNTCYASIDPLERTLPPRRKPDDEYPDDAVSIPDDIRTGMKNLTNLTKSEAIKLVNQYEEHIKNTSRESETDWEVELPENFKTQVKVDPSSLLEELEFSNGARIQIQSTSGTTKNGTEKNITTLVVTVYRNLIKVFAKEQEKRGCGERKEKVFLRDAPIISVKPIDEEGNTLSVPLIYSVEGINTSNLNDEDSDASLSCTFLKEDIEDEDWFTDGCELVSYSNNSMKCYCNHTTKFSMLFVIAPLNFTLPENHRSYIRILEYSMEGLSLFCLIVTFFVLTLVQRRRSKGSSISGMRAEERTIVHTNFVLSLSFLHFTRLFSDIATRNEQACKMIAVLSHYFMLTSGMWMLIEGALLYLTVIWRSMKNTAFGVHKYWTGWGLPAVVVIVAAGIGLSEDEYIMKEIRKECIDDEVKWISILPKSDYQEAFCWLTYNRYMIWSAVGPLLLIFSFNIFILAHTVLFVWRLNRKTDSMMPSSHNNDGKHFWITAKGILVLFPILGVPWLIGFLINVQHQTVNLVFQYIHVILNGLQGFFIFLLYCVVNSESRGIVSRVASSKWEQHKVSMSASNTLGRSTSGSRRRGRRKSSQVSSQIGGSDQNPYGIPMNMTKMGSYSSMNRKQSSGSGSTSFSGCAHRINRIITTGSDSGVYRARGGYYLRAGCSTSLPRLGRIERQKFLKRSGSVSAISHIESHSIDRFICKACKDGPCIHALGGVAGLSNYQNDGSEPTLTGYKRTSSLDNIDIPAINSSPSISEIYLQNRWPRRMTAEEFKRFSAIPEEKRRSGINSFMSTESNEHIPNRISVLHSLKDDEVKSDEVSKHLNTVDVVVEEGEKEKADSDTIYTSSKESVAEESPEIKEQETGDYSAKRELRE